MDQREKFIKDVRFGVFGISELCERYRVSRKTAYKWLGRFEGRAGLRDRNRAPNSCPHRIDRVVARTICDVRRAHSNWGPRKILQYMEPKYPMMILPAVSTAGDLLKRCGLVKKRRRNRKHLHPGVVPAVFRECGLPRAIRTDNGVPFARRGLHGLSQLNVWWIRLGIQHQRIEPALQPCFALAGERRLGDRAKFVVQFLKERAQLFTFEFVGQRLRDES